VPFHDRYRCDIERISAAELQALPDGDARLARMGTAEAVIITGGADAWPARERWATPEAFNARYGGHPLRGEIQEWPNYLNSIGEFVANHSTHHQVIWNRPPKERRCCGAAELHAAARADWRTPPFLASASVAWALSIGGGRSGAPWARHQVAWLGLAAGRKLWLVAPPHEPQPPVPACWHYDRERKTATRQCVLMPGDIIRLPLNWWHATCNLSPWTIGAGGHNWVPGRPHFDDLAPAELAVLDADVARIERSPNDLQRTLNGTAACHVTQL